MLVLIIVMFIIAVGVICGIVLGKANKAAAAQSAKTAAQTAAVTDEGVCPVCGRALTATVCPDCGFDESMYYERYETLAPVPKRVYTPVSVRRRKWLGRSAQGGEKSDTKRVALELGKLALDIALIVALMFFIYPLSYSLLNIEPFYVFCGYMFLILAFLVVGLPKHPVQNLLYGICYSAILRGSGLFFVMRWKSLKLLIVASVVLLLVKRVELIKKYVFPKLGKILLSSSQNGGA